MSACMKSPEDPFRELFAYCRLGDESEGNRGETENSATDGREETNDTRTGVAGEFESRYGRLSRPAQCLKQKQG
jgi:hypothetical protein